MYDHLKQDNWEMASNIMNITFINGKHTPHEIDFNCNKYIYFLIPSPNVVIHYLNLKFVNK
jgi:hypothetical protein